MVRLIEADKLDVLKEYVRLVNEHRAAQKAIKDATAVLQERAEAIDAFLAANREVRIYSELNDLFAKLKKSEKDKAA